MVKFGQLVIGPPGSGKTSYCKGMQEFMVSVGRKCEVVNLDFANDSLPYSCMLDVRELVALENVMEDMQLGPNGALMYCMEFLLLHADWLDRRLTELLDSEDVSCDYVIFDCPGQVELYTHHHAMETIVRHLEKTRDFRLCSVYLVDSFYCIEPATFISASMIVAATMLRIALPHINILSKVDLLPKFGKLPFPLEFYTDARELKPLAEYVNLSLEEVQATYAKLDEEDEKMKRTGVYEEEDDDDDDYVGGYDNRIEDEFEDGEDHGDDGGESDETIDDDAVDENNKQNPAIQKSKSNSNSSSSSNNRVVVVSKSQSKAASGLASGLSTVSTFRRFSESLCELLDDHGLVSFMPLSIEDPDTVVRVLLAVDKANGYSLVNQIAHQMVEKKNKNKSQNKSQEDSSKGEGLGGSGGRKGNGNDDFKDVGYAASSKANLWSFISQDLEGFDKSGIFERYSAPNTFTFGGGASKSAGSSSSSSSSSSSGGGGKIHESSSNTGSDSGNSKNIKK